MEHSPLPVGEALPIVQPLAPTWPAIGFTVSPTGTGTFRATIPDDVFVLGAANDDGREALTNVCRAIATASPFPFQSEGRPHYAYRLESGISLPSDLMLPPGIVLSRAGTTLGVPLQPPSATIPTLSNDEIKLLADAALDPVIVNNPLARFSLLGRSEEFEQQKTSAKPLLGDLCLTGQATVWYAPPNAGKTLIMLKLLIDAVADKRITPGNVFYINADDSSEGFAAKIRLMDDVGVHTLAPGHNGFQPTMLPDLLHSMASSKKAKGALIIIDTIKKAASIMDKTKSSVFTNACRTAVMAGATIVGFAHTNKMLAANGKPTFSGTTDVRDDFDAAYIAAPIEAEGFEGETVVQFDRIKSRGPNPELALYAYDSTVDLSYTERLASVRLVPDDELKGFRRIEEAKADADVIAAVEACVREGEFAKMALARAVAKRADISERAAIRIIEKYTGTDPEKSKWRFQRQGRGAMIYSLLDPVSAAPSDLGTSATPAPA